MHVHSFAPVVDASSRVLVLGSMPGKASLQANEYYAHPRNLFWPILGELVGFSTSESYADRLAHLLGAGIALWDVLESCTRASSLDSDILDSSRVPNDFATLLSRHPCISTVFFNGVKAELSFRKLVAPTLPTRVSSASYRLPSTSPANASVPYERKLEEWSFVVRAARQAVAANRGSARRSRLRHTRQVD